MSEPNPAAQLSACLSRFSTGTVALAKRCLLVCRRAFPGTNQLVYDYTKSLVVGFAMSERGDEAIVAIAVHPDSVRLYFDKSVPDPKRRLAGTGSKVRSVTLATPEDLAHEDVQALIQAAIVHSGVTFPRTGSNRIVIKSGAKAQKLAKPAKAKKSAKTAKTQKPAKKRPS